MARLEDLRQKEVINIKDGARLGFVTDVEINIKTGCVLKIIIAGPCKMLGFFGKETEYVINWCDIKKIGDDIILVDVDVDCVLRDVK
ncbi:YlmC/YmxH family sporulation protein [[Clostridium] colinum]|uniref:YlmC/YmxH family sporulation protein n=1 Tax=[Clostridium] colinum TaxID=36835 RepID=UPI002024D707|nr:YlmC/YmxH family sporulation protein [[Clostridium] colinum]